MDPWKATLRDKIPEIFEEEIEIYETQLELKKLDKIDNKIFAETRLRQGVYGQRYDNGQRHDGIRSRQLNFPSGRLLKGADTVWDAPGTQRIKVPFGVLTTAQMDVLADLSEEYSDDVLHVTTRQDFQLHFVHINDTPSLVRRLASVGMSTQESCGNVVRNVTASHLAGVCREEEFDVTPYAHALAEFLMRHPDCQGFGRKFKIAFAGSKNRACGLVVVHDLGAIAKIKKVNGKVRRGFEVYVGGGLGAIPQKAKLFDDFVPEEEILPITQAVCRVFSKLGERKNRARARLKFLVTKLGIDEFRRLVLEERKILQYDERWTSFLTEIDKYGDTPLKPPSSLNGVPKAEGFNEWYGTNVQLQKQKGYVVVTLALPLGDISSYQMRKAAHIARKYVGDNVRTTVEQNIIFRWVCEADLPSLYSELKEVGLADPGAGTITDITACPGTDTCRLGIASSRGLARVLRRQFTGKSAELDEAVRNLQIKISGCFNSCSHHPIADIGFYGNSRTLNGYKVPHFQVVLGGHLEANSGSFGLAIGSIPSKNIPQVVERIAQFYVENRADKSERFRDFIDRVGKKTIKDLLRNLTFIPTYNEDSTYYSDWDDPREFTLGDVGIGECAGEVVTLVQFELQSAEREVFEAQISLDEGQFELADQKAYHAMLQGAKALIRAKHQDVPENPDDIIREYKTLFYNTELFFDPYAGSKFGKYLLLRHENPPNQFSSETVNRQIDESRLFIEAAHSCYSKIVETQTNDTQLVLER